MMQVGTSEGTQEDEEEDDEEEEELEDEDEVEDGYYDYDMEDPDVDAEVTAKKRCVIAYNTPQYGMRQESFHSV